LPPSQAIPNTFSTKLPKKLLYHTFPSEQASPTAALRQVLNKIDKALKTFQAGETLLIFDNLNIIMTSFDSTALDYLEIFNELLSLTNQYPSLSLAIGTNRDLFPEGGSVIEFYRSLKTEFDLIVEVSRNISGYTKDVHG